MTLTTTWHHCFFVFHVYINVHINVCLFYHYTFLLFNILCSYRLVSILFNYFYANTWPSLTLRMFLLTTSCNLFIFLSNIYFIPFCIEIYNWYLSVLKCETKVEFNVIVATIFQEPNWFRWRKNIRSCQPSSKCAVVSVFSFIYVHVRARRTIFHHMR